MSFYLLFRVTQNSCFSGRDEVYTSTWYAYGAFSFMGDRNDPGQTQDTFHTQVSVY